MVAASLGGCYSEVKLIYKVYIRDFFHAVEPGPRNPHPALVATRPRTQIKLIDIAYGKGIGLCCRTKPSKDLSEVDAQPKLLSSL